MKNIFFFNLSGLIEHLKKSDNQDTFLSITYLALITSLNGIYEIVVEFVVGSSAAEAVAPMQVNRFAFALVGTVIGIAIFIWILRSFYDANGGRKNFLERLLAVSFVVGNRLAAVSIALLVVARLVSLSVGLIVTLGLVGIFVFIVLYYLMVKGALEKVSAHDYTRSLGLEENKEKVELDKQS